MIKDIYVKIYWSSKGVLRFIMSKVDDIILQPFVITTYYLTYGYWLDALLLAKWHASNVNKVDKKGQKWGIKPLRRIHWTPYVDYLKIV